MTEIHDLLDRAVGQPGPVDPGADLHRGHRALHRRRMRAASGLTGVVAVLGLAAAPVVQHLHHASVVQPGAAGEPIRTDYFDAPPPPDGWRFETARSNFVTMIPDGTPSTNIWIFEGKILIFLSGADEQLGIGQTTEYDGRTFYDNETNDDSSILTVKQDDRYWLQLQYPKSAGLSTQQMIAYLDAVVVKPAACTGFC